MQRPITNTEVKEMKLKPLEKIKYSGADWLKHYRPNMSELGCKVADILGQVYRGIYHINSEVLHKRCQWNNDHYIEIVLGRELSSWDNDELLQLIVMCHKEGIQIGISDASNGYLKLSFRSAKMLMMPVPLLSDHLEKMQPLVDALTD